MGSTLATINRMCAMLSTPRRPRQVAKPPRGGNLPGRPGMVISEAGAGLVAGAGHSYVNLGDSARLALMITPRGRGTFGEQAREVVSAMRTVLEKQPEPMVVTVQTVLDRKSTRLNSSHLVISYAVFC